MSEGSDLSGLEGLKSVSFSDLSSSIAKSAAERQGLVEKRYYESANSFLSLHSEVQSSLELLSSLEGFLSTFQSDLSSVSGHISDLQQRSRTLDARLKGRRELDGLLSTLIADITLSPRLVDLFFDSEPKQGGWVEACEDLERVLDKTQHVAQLMPAVAQITGNDPMTPVAANSLSSQQAVGASKAKTSASEAAAAAVEAARKADPSLPPEARIALESRILATSCLAIAARKLRPYLISFFHPFKSSISTNLQVLQTSVLLKPSHRSLYAFLARQAPRVAIDVQRAYLSAARLYFETGFRRYVRALDKIKTRSTGFAGSGSSTPGSGSQRPSSASSSAGASAPADALIGDVSPASMGSAALALLSRTGAFGSQPKGDLEAADQLFLLDENRLAQGFLDGAGVILGYMADNPSFKAPPEALFRSMALTFFDNACSEYTFLIRYFESLPLPRHRQTAKAGQGTSVEGGSLPASSRQSIDSKAQGLASPRIALAARQLSSATFQSMNLPGTPPLSGRSAATGADYVGPDPDESASVVADDRERQDTSQSTTFAGADKEDEDASGSIVRLSAKEQKERKGKGVEAELWRQVMEPVLGHWSSFTKSLLSSVPPPPLLSLLSMAKLNDALSVAASARGVDSVLQGPLLSFKIEAWPSIQRAFDEHIASLRKVMSNYGITTAGRPPIAGANNSAAGAAVAAVTGLTSWSGLTGLVNAAANATGNFPVEEKIATVRIVSSRFARLFVSVIQLSEEENETMLFGSLGRLRDEVEWLAKEGAMSFAKEQAKKGGSQASGDKKMLADFADIVCKGLVDNGGRVPSSHPRLQSEFSHWSEIRNQSTA